VSTDSASLSPLKTVSYTLLALIAFAANSVLCRLALELQAGSAAIDAGSFTALRLSSGIVALFAILAIKSRFDTVKTQKMEGASGSWFGAIMLFVYAAGFSYAYISLQTATGALILFAVVQMTMIITSLIKGNKFHISEWLGIAVAFAGFIYLMLPGVTAPSLSGLLLMSAAGIGWGFYTLAGKGSKDPLRDTSYNFLRTAPFIALLLLFNVDNVLLSSRGVILAVISGALTSGVGYTLWYVALTALKTTQAAVLQLLVPVIAALGGVLLVQEALSGRLMVSALLILGGILLVIAGQRIVFFERKH